MARRLLGARLLSSCPPACFCILQPPDASLGDCAARTGKALVVGYEGQL